MPTYQYRCTSCGNELEVVQKFTDPALTDCPECSGALRKIYNAVGVVFKGSGFYRTDSRTADSSANAGGEAKAEAGSSKDGGTATGDKSGEKVATAATGKDGGRNGSAGKDPKGKSSSANGSGSGTKVPAGSGSSSGS